MSFFLSVGLSRISKLMLMHNFFPDLIALMVRRFGFNIDAIEGNTGLNALGMAVSKGDLQLAEYLVCSID